MYSINPTFSFFFSFNSLYFSRFLKSIFYNCLFNLYNYRNPISLFRDLYNKKTEQDIKGETKRGSRAWSLTKNIFFWEG